MDELKKGLNISYSGSDLDRIKAAFTRAICSWGATMPHTDPLILDFGLGKFYDVGLIEYWIANEIMAGYCAKYLFLFENQMCPKHHHLKKTETFFAAHGAIEVDYNGSILKLDPGDTLLVEPGKKHSIKAISEPALFIEVSTPCIIEDNYFENRSIPIGGNYKPL